MLNQSIKLVSRRTGLSPHVIRAWERRYGAIDPSRSDTNRRLYTEAETERLSLLAALTRAGHSIGNVARLPISELRKLQKVVANEPTPFTRSTLLETGVDAVKRLDSTALETVLKDGAVELGNQGVLQKLIAPLAQSIGELWRSGEITAAHEHFATAVIRTFLGYAAAPFAAAENAPLVVVGTPSGQLHELGSLMAGAVAANLGWRVVYLGAGLPSMEIAGVAKQRTARAVALSIVYPDDDARLPAELKRLRESLPRAVRIIIGGRAAPAYIESLRAIKAQIVEDLSQFGKALDQLRRSA